LTKVHYMKDLTLEAGNKISIVSGLVKTGSMQAFIDLSACTQKDLHKMETGSVLGFTVGYDDKSSVGASLTIFKDQAALSAFIRDHRVVMQRAYSGEDGGVFEAKSVFADRKEVTAMVESPEVYIKDLQDSCDEKLREKYAQEVKLEWEPITIMQQEAEILGGDEVASSNETFGGYCSIS
jgi:hypothetical protein